MSARPETEIAKPALSLLGEMGFDLYQEVPLGARADIVGVLAGRTVCVCEVKAALTFEVIAQARAWIRYAHWRFVAVPSAYRSEGRRLAFEICELHGIGIIEVGRALNASVCLYPRLNRAAQPQRLLDALRPEHKTFAQAGSNGAFWSPWRDTVHRLVRAVYQQPGIQLKDLIATNKHHWSSNASAKGCFARQIQAGLIKELRIERAGRQMLVFPAAKTTSH